MSSLDLNHELFHQVIHIGVRVYGNGHSYSKSIVDFIGEYCRQQLSHYLDEHYRLMAMTSQNRLTFLTSIIYQSRHRKDRLKRLKQYLRAKERQDQEIEQESSMVQMTKRQKISLSDRFQQLCHRFLIEQDENNSMKTGLDPQRYRQYARLDAFYRSDFLSSKDYLLFVEQQHIYFNNMRSLSSIDIHRWLGVADRSLSWKTSLKDDLRLGEICLFLLKEILLDLMDHVFQSSKPCQISDVFRRRYVRRHLRLPYSRRRCKTMFLE